MLKSARQQAFCEQFISLMDGTKAAIAAGFSPKRASVTAHEFLKRADIQAELTRLREIRDKEFGMNAADVLRELVTNAMTDIGDVLEWGMEEVLDPEGLPMTLPDGQPIMRPVITPINSRDIDPAKRRAIKSVSMSEKGTFKIELTDRSKALEMLGRHFGIFEKDNEQAGKAAAGSVAALIAACQGKPLSPGAD
ncbi:MAG: terminase small subunit [Paracoccus sp.]|nr:terminase small subunit [Paracoccus sp. (in: a-proteobacteria)]